MSSLARRCHMGWRKVTFIPVTLQHVETSGKKVVSHPIQFVARVQGAAYFHILSLRANHAEKLTIALLDSKTAMFSVIDSLTINSWLLLHLLIAH